MSKIFIWAGIILIIIGLLWPLLVKSGIGRLPGDITIQKKNVTFYFPLMTSLLLSAALSLLLWFFSKRP
jgi:hypothetical protein